MFFILLVICSNLLLPYEILIILLLNDFLLTPTEKYTAEKSDNKKTTKTIKRRKVQSAEALLSSSINRAPELPTSWVAWFVGLLDGDGYLGLTKSNNSIKWELNLRLSSVDLPLLLHIRDTLGIGVVKEVKSAKTPVHIWTVASKPDICEVIIPLLTAHNLTFLTSARFFQLERALYVLNHKIVRFSELPSIQDNLARGLLAEEMVKFSWFHDWLIGFIEAEGSFFNFNNRVGFSISQTETIHPLTERPELLHAIQLYLGFNYALTLDKDGSYHFSTESVAGIQRMIDVVTAPGHARLVGRKLDNFNLWCAKIKTLPRYRDVKLPSK